MNVTNISTFIVSKFICYKKFIYLHVNKTAAIIDNINSQTILKFIFHLSLSAKSYIIAV